MKTLLFILFFILSAPASSAWVFPDKSADVTSDRTTLSDRWNAVFVEAKTYASMTLNGSGSLPRVTLPLPMGKTAVIDLTQFNDSVAAVGVLMVLLGVLFSFYIIFS